jgi:hypothetical protein
MSSNKQSGNYSQSNSKTSSTSASHAKPVSDYSITKDYGGMQGFMASYGLKIYNDDDIKEAHAILDAMKAADREEANHRK